MSVGDWPQASGQQRQPPTVPRLRFPCARSCKFHLSLWLQFVAQRWSLLSMRQREWKGISQRTKVRCHSPWQRQWRWCRWSYCSHRSCKCRQNAHHCHQTCIRFSRWSRISDRTFRRQSAYLANVRWLRISTITVQDLGRERVHREIHKHCDP